MYHREAQRHEQFSERLDGFPPAGAGRGGCGTGADRCVGPGLLGRRAQSREPAKICMSAKPRRATKEGQWVLRAS